MVIAMVENGQKLHKTRVCNSPELHTSKSCNCFATDDATTMQPHRIKARALAVLQRNRQRNHHATETKEPCNKPCNKSQRVAQKVALKSELNRQQLSMDFVRFCLAHENTYPDGHCSIKRDRCDPITDCLGWKMKTIKRNLH